MKTKLNLLAASIFLAATTAGLGQPVITQQPQSCTNAVGTTVSFTVTATGTEPLSYQWQKLSPAWIDLAGCTGTSLHLTNVQASHAGDYRVAITNAGGPVTSEVAHLTVPVPATLQFPTPPSFTVAENAGSVTLRLFRSGDTNAEVSVDYGTTNLSALAGLDYLATNGTLVFVPGATSQTFSITILNDGLVEGTQTFRVGLGNPSAGAVLGTYSSAVVVINDNDIGLQFQFSGYSVAEDAGAVLLGVVRGDDGVVPVTVDLVTTDLTATNGLDYFLLTNTLTFGPTERLKLFSVPILNHSLRQPNKSFRLTLSHPTGGTLGSVAAAAVTILDQDPGFQFESASCTVAEDAGAVLIRVLRGSDENSPATVDYATTDLGARNGLDYTGATNTLDFAPGEKVKVIPVAILNDGVTESPTKTFRVTLSNPTGGTLLGWRTNLTVSIQDNDAGLGFELSSYSVCEQARAGEVTLTVVRGNDGALGPITAEYATADLSARAGTDYQAVSGTLDFQANETVKSLTVPILRPPRTGGTKTFRVTLTNPTGGATLVTATTVVSILENYPTLTPPFDARLAIRREGGVNVLTWIGGGQLQRADRVTGPWQTLAVAQSPWPVQSPVPVSFYQVKGTRSANLYIPSSYTGQTNLPLVIMLHGLLNNAAAYESYVNFRALAEARGFLYCYPDGSSDRFGLFWNGTDACCDFYNSRADDAGYLEGLIEEISRRFAVDRKRVHLFGVWGGGYMAYRMGCQSADRIASLVAWSGTTYLDPGRCQPSEPVSVLHLHATAEEEFLYLGGALSPLLPWPLPANMPPYPGAMQTVQTWAAYNGAQAPVTDPTPSMDLDVNLPGLDTVVTRYTSCPPGGAVELWSIIGGSHGLVLSSQFSPRVIDWLLAHPKP